MSDKEAIKIIFNILVADRDVKSISSALTLAHEIWDKLRTETEDLEREAIWRFQMRKNAA